MLVTTNYGRNLWYIMDKFNVLPTDPSFRALTSPQIDFILRSMMEDKKEIERNQRGSQTAGPASYDTEFDYKGEDFQTASEEEREALAVAYANFLDENDKEIIQAKIEMAKDAVEGIEEDAESAREIEAREAIQSRYQEALEEAQMLARTNKTPEELIIEDSGGGEQQPYLPSDELLNNIAKLDEDDGFVTID